MGQTVVDVTVESERAIKKLYLNLGKVGHLNEVGSSEVGEASPDFRFILRIELTELAHG